MIDFAQQEFKLNASQKDGRSLKDHLLAVERQTGIRPKELDDLPELPKCFALVWEDYLNLNRTRSSGFGPGAITYTEIKNYFDLRGIDPECWEVDLIKLFDGLALSAYSSQEEAKRKLEK